MASFRTPFSMVVTGGYRAYGFISSLGYFSMAVTGV